VIKRGRWAADNLVYFSPNRNLEDSIMYAGEEVATAQGECVRFGLPVDTAILFVDKKGVYRPRIEKQRTKLLQKLGFLAKFLEADERILFVTTGCSPFTTLEQMTMGAAWLMAVKRAVFVFTNKRLLHIPATTKYQYRGSIAQVLYSDCKRLQVKGSGLVAEYHSGKKDRFWAIPRGDREIIKRFHIEAGESDQPSARPRRNHLCPGCTQLLPPEAVTCPSCGLEFKSKAKALKYSVLLPGGGYFYTRHVFLGVVDALVESYLFLVTLVGLLATLLGAPRVLSGTVIFGLILVLEKLVTIFHSNAFLDEFIPRNLGALLSGQAAPVEPPAPVPAPPQTKPCLEDVLSVR
jgi:hypothetical protein